MSGNNGKRIRSRSRPRELPKAANEATVKSFNDIHPQLVAFLYDKDNIMLDLACSKIEQTTGMKREQMCYAAFGLISLYLIMGQCAQFVSNLIGFAYPAYASVKAIRTEEKDDDTQWLTYWTVFASFSLIDFFAHVIMDVVPLYWLAKVIFLLYLSLPQTFGAAKLYVYFVDPAVTKFDEMLAGDDEKGNVAN